MAKYLALACALALVGSAAAHCNYLVDGSETLTSIAKGYKLNLTELLAANPKITNPDLIFQGEVIKIPCRSEEKGDNVLDLLEHRNDTTLLTQLIYAADLQDTLASIDEGATLFAPNDAAVEALIEKLGGNTTEILANKDLLTKVLTNHLVLGEALYSPDLPEGETEVQTALDGSKIRVINKNGTVTIKTADGVEVKVVVADLEGGNAAVHIISGVLVPSEKPAAESPAAAPKDVPCTITVKPKDTLVTLAKEYGTTVDKLAELNKIKNVDEIVAGSTLKLKDGCAEPAAETKPAAESPAAAPKA